MDDYLEKKIEVSVIVTTYNREYYLKETICSILSQTFQNFELIVVDNYSDYDFFGLVDSFSSDKIRAFQNKNNGIIAVNRNFGISKAKGRYIAFCDDDDLWEPNKLELQVNYMVSHGDVDIIGTALVLFGDGIGEETILFRKYKSINERFCDNYVTPSTVLVKKTNDVQFSEMSDFNCAEDWALWMKLYILGYKLYQMPAPLVRYRISSQNLTKQNVSKRYFRSLKILHSLRKEYGKSFNTRSYFIGVLFQYKMLILSSCLHFLYPLYKHTLRRIIKK